MFRHILICIIIVLFVIAIDIYTQTYTKEAVKDVTDRLSKIKDSLIESKDANIEEVEELIDVWNKRYEILAYYLEHDELEKIETELVSLEASIRMEEYGQAVADINRGVFLLEHLKQKTTIQVKNIF